MTTDRGATWKKVLYGDAESGAIELAADPDNASTVFAALWHVQRKPWFMDSGGNKTNRRLEVDGGLAGVELAGNVTAEIAVLRALTDCNVTRYTIEEVWVNDDQSYPAGNVNVEEQETVTMRLETAGKGASFSIPGPKDANFVSSSGPNKNIGKDTSYTPMDNFIKSFVAESGYVRISDGEQTLTSPDVFVKARRTHRGSTSG